MRSRPHPWESDRSRDTSTRPPAHTFPRIRAPLTRHVPSQAFVWDRFVGQPELEKLVRPFGYGVSLCPGRTFARREIKTFVATALAKFEFRLADPSSPRPQFDASRSGLGIFPPSTDVPVRVRCRRT